jgi:hypothetical protein
MSSAEFRKPAKPSKILAPPYELLWKVNFSIFAAHDNIFFGNPPDPDPRVRTFKR